MHHNAVWSGTPSVRGSTETTRMALLTFSLIGLQFTWGLEMTYCTPYLLELGLTKSKTSLVWVAGPLSGLIVAPIVGAVADKSTSSWGRRRPFMLGGAVLVACSLGVLGWAREITYFFLGEAALTGYSTVTVAVTSIYALDFAINAVQWSCRGLIVDTLPMSKQQTGSAWGGRMAAIGHLIGYAFGAVDLEQMFGDYLGSTQFKRMTVIAALALLVAVSVTSWAVTERVLISDGTNSSTPGVLAIFHKIFSTARHLPQRMQSICWTQFWSWIGWFPFFFYGPEWVGETYFRYEATSKPQDRLAAIGRIGSTALIIFSTINTIGSITLPWVIASPDSESNSTYTPRPPEVLKPFVGKLQFRKPSLAQAWIWGNLTFACTMFFSPFVTSSAFAATLMAICGLPCTVAGWAPHSLMGVEITRLSRSAETGELDHEINGEAKDEGLSGIYLGILNLFTTLPQFIGAFISGVVFTLFEPGRSNDSETQEGGSGIAICLLIGSCSALGASFAASRMKRIL